MHTLFIAEDAPENIEVIDLLLKELSGKEPFKSLVKFVLFHTGRVEWVKDGPTNGSPVVVYYDGFTREPQASEWGEFYLEDKSCARLVKRTSKGK